MGLSRRPPPGQASPGGRVVLRRWPAVDHTRRGSWPGRRRRLRRAGLLNLIAAAAIAILAAVYAGQQARPALPAAGGGGGAPAWRPVSLADLAEIPATHGPGESVPVAAVRPPADVAPPHLCSTAAVLIDADSGAILYDLNARKRWAPASITKVLTAIVALGNGGDLGGEITVSSRAAWTPGSRMELNTGEVYTFRDLLYGLMLESGNDAAVAIAEHVAGSVEVFASLMNAEAWKIGADSSQFQNPHGLSQVGHYSTAYDLALIGRRALREPALARVVATRETEAVERGTGRRITLQNTNRLLWEHGWVRGIKTGTTPEAGDCLMSAASAGGLHLIAVVLNSNDRWSDSLGLLSYGFEAFEARRFARAGFPGPPPAVSGGTRTAVPVFLASDLAYPVARGEADVAVRADPYAPLRAPVRPGQPCGQLVLYVGGQPVARTDLIAGVGVPRLGVWGRLWRAMTGG